MLDDDDLADQWESCKDRGRHRRANDGTTFEEFAAPHPELARNDPLAFLPGGLEKQVTSGPSP